MYAWLPTYDEWRIIKATTRRAAHERRMAEADEASADEWELAMRRDTATDPYEEQVTALEATV